jgi:predicted nucleotidyltransferase
MSTAQTQQSYRLPFPSVAETPHTTERHWRTANENLILLTEVGSRLHGIQVGGDDADMQGVCIEPPRVMLATDDFQLYEYRTQPVGVRSGEGDIDLNVYGLAKWARLIMNGNPTHLLPLFAPPDKTFAITEIGQELRENAHLFLASSHADRFLGYLQRQRERMLGNLAQRTNRPELVEEYGFDVKFASHALRIAIQGIQLMRIGKIVLPMLPEHRKYLVDVRQGKYTMGEVLKKLGSLEEELLAAGKYTTKLPARVDEDFVNDWLVGVYRKHWEEQGL